MGGRASILQLAVPLVVSQVLEHSGIPSELLRSLPGPSLPLRPTTPIPTHSLSRRSRALRQVQPEEMNRWPATPLHIAIPGLNGQAANTSSLLCPQLRRNQHHPSRLNPNLAIHTPRSSNDPVEATHRQARVRRLSFQAQD